MICRIHDARACKLGEGPLWHPTRNQLFWFDILDKRLLASGDKDPKCWRFDEVVSAAGWVDDGTLLIASETSLFSFDLDHQRRQHITWLEADNPVTRSNDGRADPLGGFWIGTMGKKLETGAGALYRWFRGELRKLVSDMTVPNAICFASDGSRVYYADTPTHMIFTQPLDAEGWPVGQPSIFVDLSAKALLPDGAVIDAKGQLWNAQWGSGRIACYSPSGALVTSLTLPANQPTCPAFGGSDFTTLFVTSASVGDVSRSAGSTFSFHPMAFTGLPEYRVRM